MGRATLEGKKKKTDKRELNKQTRDGQRRETKGRKNWNRRRHSRTKKYSSSRWGGGGKDKDLISEYDCTLVVVRQKNDQPDPMSTAE